jgi:hypothetical protein
MMSCVLACFQASAAPQPENSDLNEEDAVFGFDTQVTILVCTIKNKCQLYLC